MFWNGIGYRGWGCGWGGGWGGGILMVIIWAVVIGLIIWGAVRMSRHGYWMHAGHHDHNALDIARERYARGEIDEKEFEKIKKALS